MKKTIKTNVPLRVFLCPDLQHKAAELNRTLSRKDGTPDKSLSEMKEEIQAMLAEMRKRQLGGMKGIAEEENEYENTHTHTTLVLHLSLIQKLFLQTSVSFFNI